MSLNPPMNVCLFCFSYKNVYYSVVSHLKSVFFAKKKKKIILLYRNNKQTVKTPRSSTEEVALLYLLLLSIFLATQKEKKRLAMFQVCKCFENNVCLHFSNIHIRILLPKLSYNTTKMRYKNYTYKMLCYVVSHNVRCTTTVQAAYITLFNPKTYREKEREQKKKL